jgi:hypothetical protein
MANVPTSEDIDAYQIEQEIKNASSNNQNDGNEYVENELELKNQVILNPKANAINKMNVPDLLLGTITDAKMMTLINWWKEMQITFLEAGMIETARVYENMVLTTLNLYRSQDGSQQKYIISRIKASEIKLNAKPKNGLVDKVNNFN